MKKKYLSFLGITAASLFAVNAVAQQAINHNATQPYDKTQVQPQIRLNLEKDTDTVHWVRDNNDPYVVTKTYVLKHADPYELRPYLNNIVKARKISENNTVVECIKMLDGTGILIISAEEDRFGPQPNGMGIDEIVETLDQPKITSSSGSTYYLYFPMYRDARELQDLIWNVGTTHANDPFELQKGKDAVRVDNGTNSLLFFVPNFSKKNIVEMLKYYDNPILQASIKYTVYEIYAENDGKIGADFQSWKNNDGADLLSIGGRYRSNWTSTWSGGVNPQSGSNKTQFFSFNPKWNSKYLDFLVSKGKAKVMTTGEVVVKNNETAIIDRTTNVFVNEHVDIPDKTLTETIAASGKIYDSTDKVAASGNYYFSAKDSGGTAISLSGTSYATSIAAVKMIPQGNSSATRYQIAVEGGTFVKGGKDLGRQTTCSSFTLYRYVKTGQTSLGTNIYEWVAQTWTNDIAIAKAYQINTVAGPSFGFKMYVTPKVCRKSTIVSVKVTNSSLIGWKSNGEPRIAKNNEVSTDIMLSNKGNRFVIGGLEKTTVVRSTSGVPYLRQIPGLGWLFSSESESNKKSQLVIVAECVTSPIDEPVKKKLTTTAKKITKDVKGAGKKMSKWGFDQYYIDK